MSAKAHPPGWLPQPEYEAIYRRVPRLCVEVVVVEPDRGVLLALRDLPPNEGAWHIPGGTVLFGEPVREAVTRVAERELGLSVTPRELIAYIEYPSHYENGLDSPVGLAFRTTIDWGFADQAELPEGCAWFRELPEGLYAEQRAFLQEHCGFA